MSATNPGDIDPESPDGEVWCIIGDLQTARKKLKKKHRDNMLPSKNSAI